jgi:soluble lytic murein transglycosylase-like protein
LPLKQKLLILAMCLAPVLLAGCETTKNNASASFDLAPTDIPLPETVAVVPTSASGDVASAPVTGPSSKTDNALAAGSKGTALAADRTGPAPAENTDTATDVPLMAIAAVATPAEVPLPQPRAAAQAGDPASASGVLPPANASSVAKGMAASALAGADGASPALTLASYAKSSDPRGYLDRLIDKYAAIYEVPVDLVRRVVRRESNFNPTAFNRGHYGLMQIKHATARGMGYQGSAKGLFDAETNLKYSVKYLRGAFMVAGGNHDRADRLYQTGYYYDAKRKGLLDETGLGKDRMRRRRGAMPES